jgi:1-acyl-sn-glycerol-3-phosphate acyltransferase
MTPVEASENDAIRQALVNGILAFVADQDRLALQQIRDALAHEIDVAGPHALLALKARLTTDAGWDYCEPDPLVRRIHHLLGRRFLLADSRVIGAEFLTRVAQQPVAIFANHLSYADANVIEVLLERAGGAELASRLTAMAGPKVFTERQRRFSSLCFGTIKVPQSSEVSSGEAVLPARDVARASRRAIDVARERLESGDALLLFGEGTRSRTEAMQPMLPGVARYLTVPGTWILPLALTGPEELFPVGDPTLHPATIVMQIGRPIRAQALSECAGRDRRLIVDAIGLAVAELLPDQYRGVYGQRDQFGEAASALLNATRSAH